MYLIYFIDGSSYFHYTIKAGEDDPSICFSNPINGKWIGKFYNFHNSWRINKIHEMPFRRLWLKYLLHDVHFKPKDELCFLMSENHLISYSKKTLHYLKNRYPKAKFCFILVNPINSVLLEKVLYIRDCYDAIVTFNKTDATANDFLFYNNYP